MSGSLLCPRCYIPLVAAREGDVAVDGCVRCGGIWFDREELARLGQGPPGLLSTLEERFTRDARASCATAGLEPSRLCPVCRVHLREFEYPWAPGVRLDACARCNGIWADEGELSELERVVVRRRFEQRLKGATASGVQPTPSGAGRPPSGAPAPTSSVSPGAPSSGPSVPGGVSRSVRCPACGMLNGAGAGACWSCRAPLPPAAAPRLCPICSGTLAVLSGRGPEIEGCAGCGGLWMEEKALSGLLQLAREVLATWCARLPNPAAPPPAVPMPCPECRALLTDHPDGARLGVWLRVCSRCRRFCLRAADLPKIQDAVRRRP